MHTPHINHIWTTLCIVHYFFAILALRPKAGSRLTDIVTTRNVIFQKNRSVFTEFNRQNLHDKVNCNPKVMSHWFIDIGCVSLIHYLTVQCLIRMYTLLCKTSSRLIWAALPLHFCCISKYTFRSLWHERNSIPIIRLLLYCIANSLLLDWLSNIEYANSINYNIAQEDAMYIMCMRKNIEFTYFGYMEDGLLNRNNKYDSSLEDLDTIRVLLRSRDLFLAMLTTHIWVWKRKSLRCMWISGELQIQCNGTY